MSQFDRYLEDIEVIIGKIREDEEEHVEEVEECRRQLVMLARFADNVMTEVSREQNLHEAGGWFSRMCQGVIDEYDGGGTVCVSAAFESKVTEILQEAQGVQRLLRQERKVVSPRTCSPLYEGGSRVMSPAAIILLVTF